MSPLDRCPDWTSLNRSESPHAIDCPSVPGCPAGSGRLRACVGLGPGRRRSECARARQPASAQAGARAADPLCPERLRARSQPAGVHGAGHEQLPAAPRRLVDRPARAQPARASHEWFVFRRNAHGRRQPLWLRLGLRRRRRRPHAVQLRFGRHEVPRVPAAGERPRRAGEAAVRRALRRRPELGPARRSRLGRQWLPRQVRSHPQPGRRRRRTNVLDCNSDGDRYRECAIGAGYFGRLLRDNSNGRCRAELDLGHAQRRDLGDGRLPRAFRKGARQQRRVGQLGPGPGGAGLYQRSATPRRTRPAAERSRSRCRRLPHAAAGADAERRNALGGCTYSSQSGQVRLDVLSGT